MAGSRVKPSGNPDPILAALIAAALVGGFGAVEMLALSGTKILGDPGTPEGWFALAGALLAIFFAAVFRAYGRPRALKLAALAGMLTLVAALTALATLPASCSDAATAGQSLGCLELYTENPTASGDTATWSIWLTAIAGLLTAGLAIYALAAMVPGSRDRRARRDPAPR